MCVQWASVVRTCQIKGARLRASYLFVSGKIHGIHYGGWKKSCTTWKSREFIPRAPVFNIAGVSSSLGARVRMEKILHHLAGINFEHGGQGGRSLSQTLPESLDRGGAGFFPSTVSEKLFCYDVLSKTRNLIFAATVAVLGPSACEWLMRRRQDVLAQPGSQAI